MDILDIYDRGFGSGDEEEPLEISGEEIGTFKSFDGNAMELSSGDDIPILDIEFGRASFTWYDREGGWRRTR